ncbi:hypothetical protein GGQ74_002362 [Desulfobaculum xiamenense]|uniref:Uncharacterized protein n=1 Tax=Desulfobaculum xiamenense TaxID=995050 RepID=A0A846QVM2_9BACT|nr:hypothetical protein [Desulfobaculum xiamenense]NJB68689.1 hypothetical protein [Desulfobaculum xiamenense]
MTHPQRLAIIAMRVAPLLLALACTWRLLIEPGTIGHLNDGLVPPHSFMLADVLRSCVYAWEKHYLGGLMAMKLTTIVPVSFYTVFGLAGLDGHWATKIPLVVVIWTSIWAMASFCRWFVREHVDSRGAGPLAIEAVALASGIIYGVSPFMFSSVVTGSFVQYATFPVLPPMLRMLLELADGRPATSRVILLALCFSLVVASVQNYFIMWGFAAVVALVRFSWRMLVACAATAALTCLLNSYSFLPLLLTPGGLGGSISGMDYAAQAAGIVRHSQDLYLTMLGAGWKHRDLYMRAVPFEGIPFVIAALVPLVGVVAGLVRWRGELSRYERLFVVLWVLSVGVAAAGKGPFAALMLWGYEHIGATHIYRSPQRLMLLPTLGFCIVFAAVGVRFVARVPRQALWASALIGFAVLRGIAFYSGDLGTWRLAEAQDHSAVANYRVPPEYGCDLAASIADERAGRVLFVPVSHSPLYLETEYQIRSQGGDPTFQSSPRPAAYAFPFHPAYPWLAPLMRGFYECDPRSAAMLAGQFSAASVIVRRDLEDHSGRKGVWLENDERLFAELPEMASFERLSAGRYSERYDVADYMPMVRSFAAGMRVEPAPVPPAVQAAASGAPSGPSSVGFLLAAIGISALLARSGAVGVAVRVVRAVYRYVPDPVLALAWLGLGGLTFVPAIICAQTNIPWWDDPWSDLTFLRPFYDAFNWGGVAAAIALWHIGRFLNRMRGERRGGGWAALDTPMRFFLCCGAAFSVALPLSVLLDPVLHGRLFVVGGGCLIYYLVAAALGMAVFPAVERAADAAWADRTRAESASASLSVADS